MPRTEPVYRPTPISVLEKRNTRSKCQDRPANGLKDIPVYQPTPIKELDKYTPSSLTMYKLPTPKASGVFLEPTRPLEIPTYSPVVPRNKSSKEVTQVVGVPTYSADSILPAAGDNTSNRPFIYQPSPAYPPIMSDRESKLSSVYCKERIAIGSSSDEEEALPHEASVVRVETPDRGQTGSRVRSDCQLTDTPKVPHPVESVRKRKVDSVPASPPPDRSQTAGAEVKECDFDGDIAESAELTSDKRKKLLSLYQDLYGSDPVTDNKPLVNEKKKVRLIQPARMPSTSGGSTDLKTESPVTVTSTSDSPCRPLAPLRKSDKIPMPIRTRYLDQFIEECLVVYEAPTDAYTRALADEQACHDKAASRMAYLNAVIHQLKSLKSERLKIQSIGVKIAPSKSHTSSSLPGGRNTSKRAEVTSAEDQLDSVVQGPLLYSQLTPYILSEEDLLVNGFPQSDTSAAATRGRAILSVPEEKRALYSGLKDNERICCRCGTQFSVDDFGNALVKQKCVYHSGRPIKQRIPGFGVDLHYSCCQGDVGQQGCQICLTGHVHDANKWFDSTGFVVTLPPLVPTPSPSSTSPSLEGEDRVNVYALDCEMVYTTAGCELARVTVVDSRFRTVLDSVVRPDNPVVDCNTRFSGLQLPELEAATSRITDVQSRLLHLFDSDTILVGHSLESDLVALKLVHRRVVDTSVMFPHRMGFPKKRALRNLVAELLQKIIQQDESGHSSLEDATSCLQLVQLKVKDDLRRGKWAVK